VSHELRTPITTTILAIDIVQNYLDQMSPEQIKKRLAQSREQVGVLKELVEGILETSQIDARERKRGSMPVAVHETLERVINELKPASVSKQQIVTYTPSDEPVIVTGNPLDFTRMWRNLISNAIKYTPEGGKIYIRLARLGKDAPVTLAQSGLVNKSHLTKVLDLDNKVYLVGEVEDTGHGIRPEDFATLFQRFNRGWAEASGIPGTGLGLSLVSDLLKIYEGDIHVSSEMEKGSVFTFWLPILPDLSCRLHGLCGHVGCLMWRSTGEAQIAVKQNPAEQPDRDMRDERNLTRRNEPFDQPRDDE
ncbi:MAG: HAMP domain-containing histidine kinase, partial [Anaerolineae bacterium]|nr:HAMP domain-containing histidine kinase [Anaerolineae bacterium]